MSGRSAELGRDGRSRRAYLLSTAGIAGALSGVSVVNAGDAGGDGLSTGVIQPSGFVLEQGDTCVPLGIVASDLPVEAFYDYRSSDTDPEGWYSSYGPATQLEQAGNSVLYLYRGPRGTSLVFMHGKRESDDGGSVTFRLSGLPADGEWAVTDDQYDASTNYDTFDRSDGEWAVDWTWASDLQHGGGADGGAFRGITRDDAVTIVPAFNEAARLYGRHEDRNYVGRVENWNALSADSEGTRWRSLDMDRPVVIRGGRCGEATTQTTLTEASTDARAAATTTTTATGDTPAKTGASGPGMKTTRSVGQAGLGALTALSGLLGTGLYLIRQRDGE